ncbi:MAG: 3-deoxy-7-phosphoheptulonate synthase, partial [SAR202 cluster bacterium]|nr:3-deoxy-7-phosphoheptulonate synthase [SAR202 cluster bacterium]
RYNFQAPHLSSCAALVVHYLSALHTVVSDPSHGTGTWPLVTPLAVASAAVGADGLIIEVHPNPSEAKSDGAQSLTFKNFATLMSQVVAVRKAVSSA